MSAAGTPGWDAAFSPDTTLGLADPAAGLSDNSTRWRDTVAQAADRAGLSPDTVELALVPLFTSDVPPSAPAGPLLQTTVGGGLRVAISPLHLLARGRALALGTAFEGGPIAFEAAAFDRAAQAWETDGPGALADMDVPHRPVLEAIFSTVSGGGFLPFAQQAGEAANDCVTASLPLLEELLVREMAAAPSDGSDEGPEAALRGLVPPCLGGP